MARILVVEDEIKIAQLLHDYMAQAQFNVTMLHDGAAVIEELQSQTYDMVLLLSLIHI